MGSDVRAQQVTPLQRLHLRDLLQDRWREQVRQITVLSLARYDRPDPDRASSPAIPLTEGSSLDRSINRARARLEDLEQAMRRLDDRSYGQCARCGQPIDFTRLAQTPEETTCGPCARDGVVRPDRSTDASVA